MTITSDMAKKALEEFDCKRVQATMKALNWIWVGSNETPTIERIAEMASYLAYKLVYHPGPVKPGYQVGTGGITATAIVNSEGKMGLALQFSVTQAIAF